MNHSYEFPLLTPTLFTQPLLPYFSYFIYGILLNLLLFPMDSRNVATYSSGFTSTWRSGICRRRRGIWRKFCRYTRCCSCGTA